MAPQLVIEVNAEQKDLYDDLARVGTIAATAWFLNTFVITNPYGTPFSNSLQTLMTCLAGVAAYHLVVDTALVRFVVKRTQESFYHALKRA